MRCDITKEIQRDRQVHVSWIYRQLFQLVQTILRETVPARPFWSFHGIKHRRRLTTRVSQRHVVFKASEQIKSAKRKSRKSRREITSCSKNGSAQIRRNRIPGKRIFQNSTWRRIIKALDRNSYVISDRRVQRTVNTWPTNFLDRLMISREQMAALKTYRSQKRPAQISRTKSREVGGEIDTRNSCHSRNQSKSLIEPILYRVPKSIGLSSVELILWRSLLCEWR